MTCVSPYLAGGLTRSQCANENLLEGMGGEIMRPAPFLSKHSFVQTLNERCHQMETTELIYRFLEY